MARERTAQRGEARAETRLSRRVFVQQMAGLGAVTVLASCTDQVAIPSPTPTPKVRRIGYLSGNSNASATNYAGHLRGRLRELGYVEVRPGVPLVGEGRDIEIVFGIAESDESRLPGLAAELVAMPVDVLLAEALPAQRAARDATKSIPIVITLAADPVGAGLVTSLDRPGGNITGTTTLSGAVTRKRVQLFKESVPGVARIGIIWNANIRNMIDFVKATEDGARTLGVATEVFPAHNPVEVDAAVETMALEHLDGLVMLTGLSIIRDPRQVPDIAARYQLPQMFSDIEIVRAGGLMHFGVPYATMYRTAAQYIDRIFKGAKPSDMPIEQAPPPDFIVNNCTATKLGLTVPQSVLAQVTQVLQCQ